MRTLTGSVAPSGIATIDLSTLNWSKADPSGILTTQGDTPFDASTLAAGGSDSTSAGATWMADLTGQLATNRSLLTTNPNLWVARLYGLLAAELPDGVVYHLGLGFSTSATSIDAGGKTLAGGVRRSGAQYRVAGFACQGGDNPPITGSQFAEETTFPRTTGIGVYASLLFGRGVWGGARHHAMAVTELYADGAFTPAGHASVEQGFMRAGYPEQKASLTLDTSRTERVLAYIRMRRRAAVAGGDTIQLASLTGEFFLEPTA